MRSTIIVTQAVLLLGLVLHVEPAEAASLGRYEVYDVEGDGMLKNARRA